MDYGKLLTRSFEITRKYRALWLFGILLALFGGGGGVRGNFGFPGNVPGGGRQGGDGLPTPPRELLDALPLIVTLLVCVIIVWIIVGIVLRLLSRGALIGLVQELEANQTTPTVRRGFSIGASRFWSLLGIALLINIPLVVLSIALVLLSALPLVAALLGAAARGGSEDFGLLLAAGVLGWLALFCCVILFLILLGLAVHLLYEFIVRACVIANRGALDSIREGYRLVRANLGNAIVLYIFVIAIGIGFGLLMIPVALVLIGIPIGVGIVIYALANSAGAALLAGILIGIPMLLILLFISGLYRAFESTLWTEGYLAMSAKPVLLETQPPVRKSSRGGE